MPRKSLLTHFGDTNIIKRIILFALIVLAFLGCGAAPIHSSLLAIDPDIQRTAITPAWQTTLDAEEVDIFKLFSSEKILVGTVEFENSYWWNPAPKNLSLFNLKNGSLVWTLPRKSLGIDMERVLLVDPVLLISGLSGNKNGFKALSPSDGTILWSWQPSGASYDFLTSFNGKAVFYRKSGKGNVLLTSLDLKTGKPVWEKKIIEVSGKEQSIKVSVWQDRIFIVGSKAVSISSSDGKILWSTPVPANVSGEIILAMSDKYVVVSGSGGTAMIYSQNGQKAWSKTDLSFKIMSLRDDLLLAVMPQKRGKAWDLTALNRSGQLWKMRLSTSLESNIRYSSGKRAYFVSDNKLYSLNISNGKVVFKANLPGFMARLKTLPVNLAVFGKKIVVADEYGVSAYSAKTGKLLFTHWVKGADLYSNEFAKNRIYMRSIPKGTSSEHMYSSSFKVKTNHTSYLAPMQQWRNYASARTDSVLRSSSSTSSERQSAINAEIRAIQTTQEAEALTAQIEAGNALIGLSQQFVSMAAAWRGSGVNGRDGLDIARLAKSVESHNQAIQYGYYLRPYFKDGWGLAVVDLNTGKRSDILHSPYNEPLLIASAQYPAFLVDPLNKRILVKGLGNDSAKYMIYTKSAFSYELGFFPFRWEIPFPSIISYDIAGLKFRNKRSGFISTPVEAEKRKNKALFEAILAGNEKAVESAIINGADVNAQDAFGSTPIFYALLKADEDINELLLESGADPIACDKGGQTPLTMLLYSMPMPKGHSQVWKLHRKNAVKDYPGIIFEKRHRECMKKWGHI
jgi:outer membrane protein assembly factor BamB